MGTRDENKDPKVFGEVNEVNLKLNNIGTTALLDTGSCVSILSKSFYDEFLADHEIKPLNTILHIECADGNALPYLGCVETNITEIEGIPKMTATSCIFLVTPDTNYSNKTPVLLGTNILDELMDNCKIIHGQQYLQCANLHTPWFLAFKAITVRDRELRRNKNRLAIVRCAENTNIILGPNESRYIHGYTDKEIDYKVTSAIVQECEDSSLPSYIDITPSVITYDTKKNAEVLVNVVNLTTNSVVISPKTILCEVQPVVVDKAVFDKIEDETKSNVLDEVHVNTELTEDKRKQLEEVLLKHQDIFSKSESDIGHCDRIKHRIDLTDDVPFKQPYRRIPPSMIEEVKQHLEQLLASGVIRKSKSPWSSNVVLVRKKNGKLRMCVDYRMLNKRSVKDAYALPRTEEVFDILHGAKVFSTIDMKSGYHQVEMEEIHKERTAFTVGPLGFYEYCKMPFGLTNSPATYQRLMEECLGDYNMKICIIYLDDIIIFAKDFEEHLQRLDLVLTRLKECNLKLSAEKCFFMQKSVHFLGHVVSERGVETDPDKIEKVKNWPVPKNADELRSFVAFAGYYRRYVQDFSKVAKPLTDLLPPTSTKKKQRKIQKEWVWTETEQDAFEKLKTILTNPPILAFPDFQQPFELHVDASGKGLGAVLYNIQDGQKKVIAYASRSLSKSEKNYSAYKLEFLALKWAVTEKFKDYLMGTNFTVYTDNNPLTHILTSAKLDATGQRWASALGQFNFDIIYRSGLKNTDADSMSRYPGQEVPKEGIQLEDKAVKAICGSATLSPYIEVLPCKLLNVIEATEAQGQPMAQVEMREIRKNQREDKTIGKWVRAVIDKNLPHKSVKLSKEDLMIKKKFNSLKMIRGVMYREIQINDEMVNQLVLPECYRNSVLKGLHTDIGHPGKERTLSLIRERFYWPNMTSDIEKWVSTCDRCIRRKSSTNIRTELVNIETTYPLELVCMDYLTLEPAKGGISNILVITDHFTKYALAIPTRDQTAKTTAEALYNNFILHYGIPTKLHSDQGANFESQIIKELCQITGTIKSRTTVYHPMGNGITERYNRTLLGMLGTLEEAQKKDWKKYVPSLVYAYNCTKHETTKVSPFELMFGRKPKLPIDSAFESPVESSYSSNDTKKYLEDLRDRIETTRNIVKKHTEKAQMKQKEQFDKRAKASKIMVGDKVLVKILAFDGKHKIADRFEEDIYTIIEQPIKDIPVFKLKSEKGKELTLHRNKLLPLGEKEDIVKNIENDVQQDSVRKKSVVENNSVNRRKDASTVVDNAKAESSVLKQTVEEKEESCDSEFSDYEVIYEYVEPTYVHGDAHDMTDGKEIIEIIETEELGEMDEIEEAEGTEVTGVKEIDIHRTPVSSTSEVQSEKQDSKEIVAQTDEGLNSGIQNLNSDVDNSVTKNDRRAVDVSGESDRSPISGDEGEETSVKTLRKDTKVNSETGSVKDTKSVDARPKERVKKKNKS